MRYLSLTHCQIKGRIMNTVSTRIFLRRCCLGIVFLLGVTTIDASPPARVARLSGIQGVVSLLPAGMNDWVPAVLNRPLTIWDRLWTDKDSRTELQLGTARVCVGSYTSLAILNLDDRIAQFQITEGRINLNIQKMAPHQEYEIDTPNLAFSVRQPGDYRIEVDSEGNTRVTVYRGAGEVTGAQIAYDVTEGKSYRFVGDDLKHPQAVQLLKDDLDLLCFNRKPKTVAYVSNEVIGCEDLEDHGEWINITSYGYVWRPTLVSVGWAPYTTGYWLWVEPWGWTWIDDSPWGFAPFHYGRWIFVDAHWVWVPGPVEAIPVYAPALVEFVQLNNEIAWFPLGYNEIYSPPYPVSRNYFMNINISNTTINSSEISNIYNQKIVQQTFMNAQIPHAVSRMSQEAFVEAKSPSKSDQKIQENIIAKGKFSSAPLVSPVAQSVIGKEKSVSPPPTKVMDRATVSKNALPVAPVPFVLKQPKLIETKGKPLDPEELKKLPIPTSVSTPTPQIKAVKPQPETFSAPKTTPQEVPKLQETPKVAPPLTEPIQPIPESPKIKPEPPSQPKVDNKAEQEAREKAAQEKAEQDAQSKARALEATKVKAAQEAQEKAAAKEAVRARAAHEKAEQEAKSRAASEAAKVKAAQEAQGKAAAAEATLKAAKVKEAQEKAAQTGQSRAAAAAEAARIKAEQEAQKRASEEAAKAKAAQEKAAQDAQSKAGAIAAEAAKAKAVQEIPKLMEQGKGQEKKQDKNK